MSEIDPLHVSAGAIEYPPGGRLGPRWQHDVQLVLVHSGSARVTVDGVARAPLLGGAAGLLLPGHREHFAFADDRPTRHSWLQARLTAPPAALIERLAALPSALPASTALGELVREAVAVARTPPSTGAQLLAALAAAAIWRYVGDAESRRPGAAGPVEHARVFIHAQLGDPTVDLARIAGAAHVTPAHLVRRFRAELGATPMAYLWDRRVATGIDLLQHTGLPVGDIAARAGFKSVYHFSRRVKARTGGPAHRRPSRPLGLAHVPSPRTGRSRSSGLRRPGSTSPRGCP